MYLRTAGLPDIAALANVIGVQRCLEVSDSKESQEFRDWFWGTVANLAAREKAIHKDFLEALSTTT